ncbi:MAG: DUF63 family protein [Thermoplasmatota archaeon]
MCVEKRDRLDLYVGLAAVSVILIAGLLAIIRPSVFWDGFLYKYFFGPIVADAGGDADGITSSYNIFDTLTYGIILALSAYYIHKLFVKLKLRVGLWFFIALSPVILIGPSARVLEDMELFREPLQYVFISPVIYIFLGLSTLASLFASYLIERRFPKGGSRCSSASFLFLTIPGLSVSLIIKAFPGWYNGDIPIWPVLLITLGLSLLFSFRIERPRYERILFGFWLQVLSFVIYAYVLWGAKGEWYDRYTDIANSTPESALGGGMIIIGIMITTTAITALVLYLLSRRFDRLRKIVKGVNIMIIGGHMLDASATYMGIDHYGYVEKHVLPDFLIRTTGTALVMFPLKLVFILPAVYFIEKLAEDEMKENEHMIALVKLAILILGFAPGTRDAIRLMVGV